MDQIAKYKMEYPKLPELFMDMSKQYWINFKACVSGLICMTISSQMGTPSTGNAAPEKIHIGKSSTVIMA